jgi:uncharacterized membrane protein
MEMTMVECYDEPETLYRHSTTKSNVEDTLSKALCRHIARKTKLLMQEFTMSESPQSHDAEKMASLKTLTGVVYLCQVLAFGFGGLTLLVGIAINFMKRNEVRGTWLESHFDWQINTVWITLAGFAIAALLMFTGIGYFILLPVVLLLIYRIVIGWMAWTAEKPVKQIAQ